MQELKPCARCELELPESKFDDPDDMFCSACTQEMVEIIRSKYNAIEAALFRAKLRQQSKSIQNKLRE